MVIRPYLIFSLMETNTCVKVYIVNQSEWIDLRISSGRVLTKIDHKQIKSILPSPRTGACCLAFLTAGGGVCCFGGECRGRFQPSQWPLVLRLMWSWGSDTSWIVLSYKIYATYKYAYWSPLPDRQLDRALVVNWLLINYKKLSVTKFTYNQV